MVTITFLCLSRHVLPSVDYIRQCYVLVFAVQQGELVIYIYVYPGGSDGEESACNAGDLGLILGLGRSPGEGKATRSRILAWRIPWTEEPGGLQSMGSQRVRHD